MYKVMYNIFAEIQLNSYLLFVQVKVQQNPKTVKWEDDIESILRVFDVI